MKKKFEYFLNAIHYCIYLEEVWTTKKMEKIVYGFLFFISKYFFPKRLKIKVYRRYLQSRQELNEYFYGKEFGQSIGVAHHLFGFFYSGYPIFLSFVIWGVVLRYFGTFNLPKIIIISILAIPIGLCYIPAYKVVFAKDRYLEYFKQFEKEDELWHKKWKKKTIAFCIGSVVVEILGICAAFTIAIICN